MVSSEAAGPLPSAPAKATGWRPAPTIGAVPRRVEKYRLFPLWLPSKPAFAKDPRVVALGDSLMATILADTRHSTAKDPWAQRLLWRDHPYFSAWHKLRLAFPGLGIALVSFGLYLALEHVGIVPAPHHHSKHDPHASH